MSFGLDFQFLEDDFLFEEGYENGKTDSDSHSFNVDDVFESKNPLFGNDLSLASALNFNSGDDFLACCASTDENSSLHGNGNGVQQIDPIIVVEKTQSPWHESDSGMSDTSSSPSPNTLYQEEASVATPQQTSANDNDMDLLNVNIEDLDSDGHCSTSSSSTKSTTPTHIYQDAQLNSANSTVIDDLFTEEDIRQKAALEFFESYSNQPKTLKLVKVQQVDVPEEKSRKNAIQAKINREKKKAYIKSLEDETTSLRSDNAKLKSENQRMLSNISELEEEVEYLKSVLVNSSALSGLLKNISNVPEVKLSATVIGRKRSVADDHSYNFESSHSKRARRINENLKKAGVCLHVNGGSASLEFCAHCSKLARRTSLS